jgi:hypothetical protein
MDNLNLLAVVGTILIVLALVLVGGSMPAKANELSDFQYVVSHQDTPRNVAWLNEMVYQYGSPDKLVTRMNALYGSPKLTVNSYATFNHTTGHLEYSGNWTTN